MRSRIILIMSVLLVGAITGNAQKIYTKNGSVSFFSKATLENITADNNEVVSLLNKQTGELQFSVLIKSFHFKKSLMEEHFNENYMESDKYPKASFKGKIDNLSAVNFSADGTYNVTVSGTITIHGVTKNVSSPAKFVVKGGIATGSAKFSVKPADYKISIPGVVKDNIAETIDVTVNCTYNQKM